MTHPDLRRLLTCIEIYLKTSVLASACHRDLMYSYQLEADGLARLSVYHNHLLPDVPEIEPGYEWYVKKKLWFRKNILHAEKCAQGIDFFEPLVDFLPEYTPLVTVDLLKPLASTRIHLPFKPSQTFISTQTQGAFT